MIYHYLFGNKKILSQKPKQTVINLILDLTFNGWKQVRNVIMHHFGNSKDAEYRMMIDLLDNSTPVQPGPQPDRADVCEVQGRGPPAQATDRGGVRRA